MGAKQTKQSNQLIENENTNNNNNTLLRAKRQRKSTSTLQLNRTSSSPVMHHAHSNTKWRMSTFFHDVTNTTSSKSSSNDYENHRPIVSSSNLTSSKSSMSLSTQPSPTNTQAKSNGVLSLNQQMKSNQQRLTNIIKQADSNQPSYHLNSKLYRPSSFLLANSNPVVPPVPVSNRVVNLNLRQQANSNNNNNKPDTSTHTLPRTHVHIANSDANMKQQHQSTPIIKSDSNVTNNSNTNSNKIPVTSKIAKKLGLSPRFKRKIVETITNKVSSHTNSSSSNNLNHKSTNSIFSQSRLIQALQSQWNLFSSIRLSRSNLNQSGDENDLENDDDNDSLDEHGNKKRFFHRHQTTATFLSTSLQRNSFRYASRRKYKTQSLANPFRHADTNYPVYIHEALFMPEFSVKGQVTEADFEILDVISRGAFGHVIKVKKKSNEHTESEHQIFAMKIMWKSQVIRDRALQQVKDEVTIAINCVDNPLIVKTWHYWQSKRFLYIITDYVENGELLSLWLKVHHFPERLAILYAVEMSLVLDYLHKRGIIYRDIKMENILLDQRGHIQLIDFGLSKWLRLGERTGTICGTIQYMAPEILSVEPYDHSVDWWSLGILIYALLSGEYPLNAAKDHIQMNEKVSKHVFELDRSRGNYTEEACDLVRKLLRKNPQRRLKSLNEIRKEPFFLKEVNLFVSKTLEAESAASLIANKKADHMSDADKRAIVSENFWNPYVIMENYSPLQMLFDEIYAMKQKQQEIRLRNKANKLALAQTNAVAATPAPPPPPPPPEVATASGDQQPQHDSSSSTNTISSNKSLTEDEEEAASAGLMNTQIQNSSYENNNTNLQSINEYDGDNDDEEDEVSIMNSFTKF